MKLIIGLGNPGEKYETTRHNAGFMFLDVLKDFFALPEFTYNKKFDIDITEGFININEKIILVKPQTYMNNSGRSARALIDFYKINPKEIMVISDDLDIETGKYKISKGTRAAGHNGIQNIIDAIDTQDFTRIRIGVEKTGGRCKRGEIPGDKFVLQKFDDTELDILKSTMTQIISEIQKNHLNKILLR